MCLQIYESHDVPHKYACFAMYSSPRSPYVKEQLAQTGSNWEVAYASFCAFFKTKTKRVWEDRLEEIEGPADPAAFVWTPPPVTEPRGVTLKDTAGYNG